MYSKRDTWCKLTTDVNIEGEGSWSVLEGWSGVRALHSSVTVKSFTAEFQCLLLRCWKGWKLCCLSPASGRKSCSSGGNCSHRVHVQPMRERTTHSYEARFGDGAHFRPSHTILYLRSSPVPGWWARPSGSCPAPLAWWWWRSDTAPPVWQSSPLTQSGHSPSARLLPPSPPCGRTPPTSLFWRQVHQWANIQRESELRRFTNSHFIDYSYKEIDFMYIGSSVLLGFRTFEHENIYIYALT